MKKLIMVSLVLLVLFLACVKKPEPQENPQTNIPQEETTQTVNAVNDDIENLDDLTKDLDMADLENLDSELSELDSIV